MSKRFCWNLPFPYFDKIKSRKIKNLQRKIKQEKYPSPRRGEQDKDKNRDKDLSLAGNSVSVSPVVPAKSTNL